MVEPVWSDVRGGDQETTRSSFSLWRWHLDEVFVRINGETHYLWRAVDHEGGVFEVFVTKHRDRRAALKFLKRTSPGLFTRPTRIGVS